MKGVKLPDQAQVDQGHPIVRGDEDVPRVQIGMNETVLEDHLHEGVHAQPGDAFGIRSGLADAQDLGPFDKRHAQDALAGQLGQYLGEDHLVLVAEVFAKTSVVVRLDAEVELGEYRASEFLDRRLRLHRDKGGQLA